LHDAARWLNGMAQVCAMAYTRCGYFPTRRAARMDPIEAQWHE